MKILWVTNIPLPSISKATGEKPLFGGGWLVRLSEDIVTLENNTLVVCFPIESKNRLVKGNTENITYYGVPCDKFSCADQTATVDYFCTILSTEKPDIIHIWGTEYTHSYCMAKACQVCNTLQYTVVSIQGLVSIYAHYYYADLPLREIVRPTVKEMIRRKGLVYEKNAFIRRGEIEQKCLKIVPNVIGRTDWDYACTGIINKNRKYYFCNETLRDSFYRSQWDISKVTRHSIFCSQAQYPIKGFHKVLEAASLLLNDYPDLRIVTTGKNRNVKSVKERLSFSSYDRYINRLITEYGLENHIVFLGALSEDEMREQYLTTHVFVSPSSIENSPNSLGEAMLLGVPAITSDVGGVRNMLSHKTEGYIYPFNDVYILSEYIRKIFDSDKLAHDISVAARAHALETHNRATNYKRMMEIYEEIHG